MKKEAFLIVLFFSFFGSYAQSYIPFPEKDAEWVSRILYEDPQSKGGDYCYNSHIKTDGDTIINGLKYIKLTETKIHRIYRPFVCMGIDTAAPITTKLYGWMRNDSINKKVYIKKRYMTNDTLLYDFDLQIGDTLPSTFLFFNNWNSNPYVIQSTKQSNIAGKIRNVFLYGNGANSNSDSLVEGIGSFYGENGMNLILTGGAGLNATFLCMSISGNKVFPLNGNCQLITSIDEEKTKGLEINIFPNPAKNIFSIEYPEGIAIKSIQLYDCIGRLAKKFMPGKEVYDIGNLPAGIYFVQIEIKGQFHSHKLMIE